MSWEGTNPPERDELEFCGACGYKLEEEEVGDALCQGCALDTCPQCVEYLEDCECEDEDPSCSCQGLDCFCRVACEP